MPESSLIDYGISLEQYCSATRHPGAALIRCSGETYAWRWSELRSLERAPVCRTDIPSGKELRQLFWNHWPSVITYVRDPDSSHPPNAWLYVCEDKAYRLEKLGTQGRRNVRRALRAFQFGCVNDKLLRGKGERAFCDTRTRVGLSDGTAKGFERLCDSIADNPAQQVLGAWHESELAAFLTAIVVEDWVEFTVYAANAHMKASPNAGLIFRLINDFLVSGRGRFVSWGLSSIQDADNVMSLDYFKRQLGFEARPVHRAFHSHPLLRPFNNSLTYWSLQRLLRVWPRNRLLRKGVGLVAMQLGCHKPLPAPAPAENGADPPSESLVK